MQVRHMILYGAIGVALILLIVGSWIRSRPDVEIGKRLVTNSCGLCHDLTAEQNQERGPYLWGVYGRDAGITGFRHSVAFLKKITHEHIVWNDEQLDLFIRDPDAFIPRTEMGKPDAKHPTVFEGIVSSANRRDVLAYLKTLH